MKSKKVILGILVVGSALLAGCASPGLGGGSYTRSQARGEMNVRLGVVEAVRDVTIDARDSGTGVLAGAALGGIAGSTLGRGNKAEAAGAIAGAVLGGLAGAGIEKSSNDRRGVEVTVKLEGGKLVAITQEKDEEFRVGDRVRILSGNGATRVTKM